MLECWESVPPQHLHVGRFMAISAPGEFAQHSTPVPIPAVVADGAERMEQDPSDSAVGDHLSHTGYKGKCGQRLQRIHQREERPQMNSDGHGFHRPSFCPAFSALDYCPLSGLALG